MSTDLQYTPRPDGALPELDSSAPAAVESDGMSNELVSETFGVRSRIDETDSNAEVGRAYVQAAKGANGGPPHIHLQQEERFIVHTGVLLIRRGRDRLRITAGEDVRIPPRVAHTFRAEVESTYTVEFRPPMRLREFFTDLFALPTDNRGNPKIGDAARLMRAYPDEFLYLPHIPIWFQRVLAIPLSKLGPRPKQKALAMSHPDPNSPPDLTPVRLGEVFENPVTRERSTLLERPTDNPEGRATFELTALAGARVVGEHRHPALVERFTVLEGELTLKRDGQTSILREGETGVIDADVWHDWWNASDKDARVRVEITPGERFAHMAETLFGLARLGYTNDKGMPSTLQLALIAQEFSDVIVFRKPPPTVQRAIFALLAPIARRRGYRPTYPQLSRTMLAPRP